MIRTIKHYQFTIPASTPGDVTVSISPVDPNRSMVFFQGAGYREAGPTTAPYAAPNIPFIKSLSSSALVVNFPFDNKEATACGCTIIDYI